MKLWNFVGIIGLGTLGAAGCGSSDAQVPSAPESYGTARIAITQAPSDVECISITATGATSKSTNFSVTPGQSTTLTMTGVPTGTVSFSGKAFNVACSSISGATPDYVSNTVTTTVTGSTPALVNLSMTRNTSVQVNVDFPDGGTCGGNDAVCDPAAMPPTCCAGFVCTANAMGMSALCLPASSCGVVGTACDPNTMPVSCCSGLVCTANPAGMGGGGSCQAPACSSAGAICKVASDCCSGLSCLSDPAQMGVSTCQGPSCGNAGSVCKTAVDCCAGLSCVGDPTMGLSTCQATCGNPGSVCKTNADCCSGLGCVGDPTMGVLTCQAPGCGNSGATCKLNSDCCGGLSCVTDPTMGVSTCQSTCGLAGAACGAAADPACCSGLSCTSTPMGSFCK